MLAGTSTLILGGWGVSNCKELLETPSPSVELEESTAAQDQDVDNGVRANLSVDKSGEDAQDAAPTEDVEAVAAQELTLLQLLVGSPYDLCLFAGAVVLAVLTSCVTVQLPGVVGNFIDIFKGGDSQGSKPAGGMGPFAHLASLFAAKAVLNFGLFSVLSYATERLCERVKTLLFTRILQMDMARFDTTKTGELMDRISGDIEEMRAMYKHSIALGLRSGVTLVGCVLSLVRISGKLSAIMAIAVPFVVAAGSVYGKFLRGLSRSVKDSQSEAAAAAQEAISNVRTVRAFANEDMECAKYSDRIHHVHSQAAVLSTCIGVFHTLSMMSLNGLVMMTLCVGERLVKTGDLTGGNLASFIMYAMRLPGALGKFSVLYGEISKGLAASERILELVNAPVTVPVRGGQVPGAVGQGQVLFKDVNFVYPSRPEVPVFSGLNLHIPAGKTTALVGPSGSGKSTVVALLEKFYLPDAGQVVLDGYDLHELDPSWVRGKVIAVVNQEPVLFATSIANNIKYARPDATHEEVVNAARTANCHDFISAFPDGYHTTVGERGMSLSGGQKQRIAIARAVLKDAAVLVLDEATSALDATSEKAVQEALDRLTAGKTTLVIAHRLSTVQDADQIAVLQGGQVVEQGTHSSLMKKQGVYARLVANQLQK